MSEALNETDVIHDGEIVGTVWKVPGRSFTGAWRSLDIEGRVRTGFHTRREAREHLIRTSKRKNNDA